MDPRTSPSRDPPPSRSLRRCIAAPELPLDELTVPVENRSCGRRTSSPTAAAEPASPLAGSIDPAPSGRSAQTALEPSEPLGWAEIRHPFHPLRGQRFPVLKRRRVAGVDTLILRELQRGTFSVAREWTDWADPPTYNSLGLPPGRLDIDSLLELVTFLEQLTHAPTKRLTP